MSFIQTLFKKFSFSKSASPESVKAAEESMLNIINAFGLLDEKAKNIQEKFPQAKAKIHEYFEETKKIQPSVSVRAGKFEQALLLQITKVSSCIDKIFSTGDEEGLFEELKVLERFVRVRTNADSEGGDD